MKKVWVFLKRFWWIILSGIAFVLGWLFRPSSKHPDIRRLEKERTKLQEEEKDLKKEQEKLEKEAEKIEKKRYFNDPVNAARYINDTLRKRHK